MSDQTPTPRPPVANDPGLVEVLRRLVEAYRPERVYLVPDDAPSQRRGSRLAYEVLRGTGTAADVLVCTRSYFDARLHLRASLPATVVREGVLLHAA